MAEGEHLQVVETQSPLVHGALSKSPSRVWSRLLTDSQDDTPTGLSDHHWATPPWEKVFCRPCKGSFQSMHDIARHMTKASYQSLVLPVFSPHLFTSSGSGHHIPVWPGSLNHRLSSQLLIFTSALDCSDSYSVMLFTYYLALSQRHHLSFVLWLQRAINYKQEALLPSASSYSMGLEQLSHQGARIRPWRAAPSWDFYSHDPILVVIRWLSDKESTEQEMRIQSLGQEDLLGKEAAPHSSILAGKSHG